MQISVSFERVIESACASLRIENAELIDFWKTLKTLKMTKLRLTGTYLAREIFHSRANSA